MALVYKQISAKAIVAADTNETLYTVPASNRVVGQLICVNTNPTTAVTFRLAVIPNGATLGPEHYLSYDASLNPKEILTIGGITIEAGDVIMMRSDTISDTTPGTGLVVQLYGELDNNV